MYQFLVNTIIYCKHPRLIIRYYQKIKCFPNVAHPHSIEEKFLWRKIFDHNPVFVEISDKLKAKEYALNICPDLQIAKTQWVGTDARDIPDEFLTSTSILKANHGSGFNEFLSRGPICRQAFEAKTREWLTSSYGQEKNRGEWAYQGINRKIFLEEEIISPSGQVPLEFKIHVCAGKTIYTFCLKDRFGKQPTAILLDRRGKSCAAARNLNYNVVHSDTPAHYQKLIQMAEKLGENFDYIRCDFYELDGTIFFGELTVYPVSGFPWIGNDKLLKALNKGWRIEKSWFLSSVQQGWKKLYASALLKHINSKNRSKIR